MLNKILSRDSEAFTLVEAAIVVLILISLSAIAVPLFMHQQERAEDAATMTAVAAKGQMLADQLGHDPQTQMSGVSGDGETKIELVAANTGTIESEASGAIVYAQNDPLAWCVSKASPTGTIFALTSSMPGRVEPVAVVEQCTSATSNPAPVDDSGDPGAPGDPGDGLLHIAVRCEAGAGGDWPRWVDAVNNDFGGDESAAIAGGAQRPYWLAWGGVEAYASWNQPADDPGNPITKYQVEWLLNGDAGMLVPLDDAPAGNVTNYHLAAADPGDPNGLVVTPVFSDGSHGTPVTQRFSSALDLTVANRDGCTVTDLP